jgi:DNA repair exonuclease SbcCD ATPase subunit
MSKIIKLQAENVKRLKAVEITPEGNTVIITGRNEQGKTSVLDSIWFCLGGKDSMKDTPTPIRNGEESAAVRIETDDLIIERTWSGNDKSYLKVMSKDGATHPSPQAMLDKLVGNLSFDPLEFSKQEQKEQVATLLQLVNIGIDLDALAEKKKQLYDERTQVNREFKTLQAMHTQLDKPQSTLPDEELSISDLNTELKIAIAKNQENAKKRELLTQLDGEMKEVDAEIKSVLKHLEDLKMELADYEEKKGGIQKRVSNGQAIVKSLVDIDTDEIQEKILQAEETNQLIRQRNAYSNIENQMGEKHVESESLTGEIEALEKSKTDAIAKAKFPIEKLSFDENGVLYKGIPFSQCSSAERLRVSLAIAMALNPKLRVIRVMDGSLLDKDNLKAISDMAKEKDYQIWIETISNENIDPLAVYIEDGSIVKVEPKRNGRKVRKEQ